MTPIEVINQKIYLKKQFIEMLKDQLQEEREKLIELESQAEALRAVEFGGEK